MSLVLDGTGGVTTNSGTLLSTSDATINGLTVGKGGGNVATNTAHGVGALATNSSAGTSVAVGYQAAYTSNTYITAVGYQALRLATGGENTAFGYNAGNSITTGGGNTIIGERAGNAMTTGSTNVLIGSYAVGAGVLTGDSNIAIGRQVLQNATTAGNNIALGRETMLSATSASNSVAVGFEALNSNTTPSGNIAIGYQAVRNGNGGNVTAVGYQAGIGSTCDNASYFGYQCGYNATGGNGAIAIGAKINFGSASPINEVVLGVNAGATVTGKGNSSFFVIAGGGGYYNGANQTAWNTTSDRRIKKNIVDNTDGLNKITGIRVRNFEYRLPEEIDELPPEQAVLKSGVQLGVIAQELQEVLPDCITEMSTGVLTVQNDNLTWHMVNAIKELKAIVDTQAAEIAELKAKVM